MHAELDPGKLNSSSTKEWQFVPLGRCGKWLSGGTPSTENSAFWNGDIPWITASSWPDWTRSSREDIQAGMRAAVKRVLRVKGVKAEDFDLIIARVMEHALAVYRDWPAPPIE